MYVLDTNVVSALRKGKPHPALLPWVGGMNPARIATAAPVIIEIQRGIELARAQHPDFAQEAETWLDGMLAAGAPKVLPLDAVAARLLGRMFEASALRNFVLTDRQARAQATGADLAIAAIAIVADATVATGNVRHFLQIHASFPLPGLFDPFAQTWHVGSAA